MNKSLTTLALAAAIIFGMTACTSPEAPATISVSAHTVIVDVRTASEYAGGHLEGAVNIDVQSPDFDTLITALPLDGAYIVYCASGNRSRTAVAHMTDLGFTTLTDAGGVTEASVATGIPLVSS